MSQSWKNILIKFVCIFLFIVIFYKLTNLTYNSSSYSSYIYEPFETLENSLEQEKINYIKLRETYIEPKDSSLELLYANYSGEEVNNDVWENKTLDQCTNICNNIPGCSGFSRDLVLDSEPAKCYPHNIVNNCHSNRKGNLTQMQNAIKYNSFIKSNVSNVLNNCIGDSDLTLNRTVFIKSYAMPNKYLGSTGDSRVEMIDQSTGDIMSLCNFRIEQGKDGVGTVSFLHISTNKYLYRDISSSIILKDITSGKTEDKQRASFNLYDSMINSDSIMLRSMPIEGEVTDKFVIIDDSNKYLNITSYGNSSSINSSSSSSSSSNSTTNKDNSYFYIIDSIVKSNIITSKNNIPQNTNNINNNNASKSNASKPNSSKPNSSKPNSSKSNSSKSNSSNPTIQENFTVNLDSIKDNSLYDNLFIEQPETELTLPDYLNSNYSPSQNNNVGYISITNKLNDIILKKELSTSLTANEDEYNSIYILNKEIEKEIGNLNLDLNAKNDNVIKKLDRMRITDMSNDYFFLQNISNK